MAFVDNRLTLFAVISSIEQDLRSVIIEQLWPQIQTIALLLGEELYERCARRFVDEHSSDPAEDAAGELLAFSDLGDLCGIANSHRSLLPQHIGKHIRSSTKDFDLLVPVRNRVMHNRPLRFEDLPETLLLANRLVNTDVLLWSKTRTTLERLQCEPHFVLGLTMPAEHNGPAGHNLPSPDFDETGFLGRTEEIARLTALIRGPYPVITIVGVGGVGKTALAVKVAYDLLDSDPDLFDAVVWSSSKTAQLTTAEVIKVRDGITDSLGLMKAVASELAGDISVEPIPEILEYLKEFRVLVILDNLETVLDERVRGFLGQLPAGSKVLITSRVGVGAFEHPVNLAPLKQDEALQLLRALAKARDVTSLVKTTNKQLEIYCSRLKHNPGFIKWFVSSVQTGLRPEEALGNPDTFLDFCMSNVYRYLSEPAKHVLDCMMTVPNKQGQAELSFLADFEPLKIQQALQELVSANMILMVSVPQDGSYYSQYRLDSLTQTYLNKHHPVASDAFQRVLGKKRQLVSLTEAAHAKKGDPFSPYMIATRSRSDFVVAKYLQDALQHIKRNEWVKADEHIEHARSLSPDYFEVHRVEAWKFYQQKNMPAARTSYEAAIELNPASVPLRLWYGGFLLQIDETAEAYEQLSNGLRLDGSSMPIQIELARVSLYLRRFDEATPLLERCVEAADGLVSERQRRKAWDLLFQVHRRKADLAILNQAYYDALCSCREFRKAYETCPRGLIDQRMKEQVDVMLQLGRTGGRFLTDAALKKEVDDFVEWCESEACRPIDEQCAIEPDVHGVVKEIHRKHAYGFILLDDGRSVFFHRSYLSEEAYWGTLCEGAEVECTVTRSEKGLEGKNIRNVATFDSSPHYGVVKRKQETFGFIQTDSGSELFFHKGGMLSNSEWAAVTEGTRVEFVMGENEKGPIADRVCRAQDRAR